MLQLILTVILFAALGVFAVAYTGFWAWIICNSIRADLELRRRGA